MSKSCCSTPTTVHWKSFPKPHVESATDEKPSHQDGWLTEHLSSSISSFLSRPHAWVDADVALVLRNCESCTSALHERFGVPSFWWSSYCHNANGYFGSSAARDKDGGIASHISWAKFRVKAVQEANTYSWYITNVFVYWLPNRTTILLFDTPAGLFDKLPAGIFEGLSHPELSDPFWVYGYLVADVVHMLDTRVWDFRTLIRNIEKARVASNDPPQPDFGGLHDLARHSVHFLEVFGLAIKTISDILRDHASLKLASGSANSSSPPAPGVRDKLCFFENMLENLQQRASSNHQRLHNEIQLTFNLVTQYDAKLSIQLSSAMKADGAATKALTLLASAFLPATFICALFSMSFFSYQPETGWVMASQIWMYFAFAVPTTFLTIWAWRYGPWIMAKVAN